MSQLKATRISAEGDEESTLDRQRFLDSRPVEIVAQLLKGGGFSQELGGGVATGQGGGSTRKIRKI